MPIHDWKRMTAGDFHHFHQTWIIEIAKALNGGILPSGYMAMAEQVTGRPIPDVVTLQTGKKLKRGDHGGVATAPAPASARLIQKIERVNYAKRQNRIAIHHGRGEVVAILEIVSPGNKDSRNAIRSFIEKAADFLNQGVHLMIVDLFPPTPRDPHGVHKALWDEFCSEPFAFDPEKPFTVASYLAGDFPTAYVEPIGVGDVLPESPIFLSDDDTDYVKVPLEATYMEAWRVFPAILKEVMAGSESSAQQA